MRRFFESLLCGSSTERAAVLKDSPRARDTSMLMTKQRRPTIRTLRGWAISMLREAGAIRGCEEHGWMQDRADPTPESAPSLSLVSIPRPVSLATRLLPRFVTYSIQSVAPAQNARREVRKWWYIYPVRYIY
jgi:hypothetical protein